MLVLPLAQSEKLTVMFMENTWTWLAKIAINISAFTVAFNVFAFLFCLYAVLIHYQLWKIAKALETLAYPPKLEIIPYTHNTTKEEDKDERHTT